MKKTILSVLICLLLTVNCLTLCACGHETVTEGSGELKIVCTLFPAYDFAREITGGRAEVTLLVPPGSESHSFEPSPRDMERIAACDLLICNGGESEAWLEELLDGFEEEIPTIVMLESVNALEEEIKEGMQSREEEHDEEDEPEYDEHVWTSPVNAELICTQICIRLCELSEENAEFFRENLARYSEELEALDAGFRETVEASAKPVMIFADRFPVRYFTEEYGIEYFAAFPGCADDAEPSAKTVAFLIDRVRDEKLPAVYYIEFSNQKMADIVCEDTGCKKLLFHSCHNVSRSDLENGVSYLSLMQENLKSLREGLADGNT